MDINFHQTFKPERNYISELLQVAEEAKNVTLEELSNMTGIPQGKSSGKLVPHLKYAQYMGLITYTSKNGEYSIELTNLGAEILDQDMSLTEDVSLLVLNANLVSSSSEAEPWSFCFNDYFRKYGKSSKYDYFLKEVELRYGNKIKFGPFLKTYEEMFSQLELLLINSDKASNDESMVFRKINCKQELLPAIGYLFYDSWDRKFPDDVEITSTQLGKMDFRCLFGWSNLEELDALERLSDYGLIRMNKQLMPFTIIRLKEKKDLIKSLYSELF